MTNKKLIANGIDSVLSVYGFKKKSDNWYCHKNEIIQLVNLQKSNYGGQFYVNCGVLIKALSDIEFPKEENCHIRFRLNHEDIGIPKNKVDSLLDLENDSRIDEDRVEELSSIFVGYIMPIFEECSTVQGISKIIKSEKSNNWAIRKNVKEFLCK